jgi:hypothetical protein
MSQNLHTCASVSLGRSRVSRNSEIHSGERTSPALHGPTSPNDELSDQQPMPILDAQGTTSENEVVPSTQ